MRKSDHCPHSYRHCADADARSVMSACRKCQVPIEKVIREREKRDRLYVVPSA
ncbi:MAG: hypothetical protein K6T65_10425 [Peptococcaceae bacterium]|nr:hypothetical protein [Peptococcaceae bacterium]